MAIVTQGPLAGVSRSSPAEPRLVRHPWRAFLLVLALHGAGFALVGLVLYRALRLPQDLSSIEAFPTAAHFTLAGLFGYLVVPYLLHLPNGSHGVRRYLDDIRLTRVKPFVPLLLLTLSCQLILIVCQGAGSIVYRLSEGKPVTSAFIGQVFDLPGVLPPQSTLLFAQMFSSLEEVLFRGVLLTMLLRVHSPRNAIVFSAAAFGLMHLPGVFAGTPPVVAVGQAVWAFLFGLFYGYIFLKSGSLLPSMVIHWLSNVFQASLTAYFATAPAPVRALYGVVFGYGLAAALMLLWVRAFADRWLPRSPGNGLPSMESMTTRPGRA
jgi:membrane protease YdiL (CAAX protease family)